MTRVVAALGMLSFAALLLTEPSAPADAAKALKASDAFFKNSPVLHIGIEVEPKEADALRREPRKYAKATVKVGDQVFKDVGIHLKGAAGSFRGFDDKPGLTLNMDKFTDGQLLNGMDKLHLSNSVQDPSYLSELLCGELFRAAGVPAARVSHALVTINGKRKGLYYLKEGYDSLFLKRHFGGSDGNFYDGGFLRDIDQPLQLLSGKGDVANHADLKALLKAAQEGNHEQRFAKMEKVLDMDKFISYLVLESVLWDWDGYPMNRNNYRIYHDPKADKLIFIPSGMDQMFGNLDGPVFPNFQGFAARALLETPEGKKRYVARMQQIMTDVFKTDELLKRLDELEARVQPELASIDAGAGRDYKNQVDRLRHAVKERPKKLAEQMKNLPK